MKNPRAMLVVAMVGTATTFGSGLWALSQPPTTPPSTPPSSPPTNPTNPSNPSNPPGRLPGDRRPGDLPIDRRPGDLDRQPGMSDTARSPFSFNSPQAETKFREGVRDLVRMEQQLERSHSDLMQRLGEIHSLPVERQNAAILDILQQMMQQHEELARYLVQSRTAWTGDVKLDDSTFPGTDRPLTPAPPPGGGGR